MKIWEALEHGKSNIADLDVLPARQTVRLLVKEMEQYFLVLQIPRNTDQGRVCPLTSSASKSLLGERCSANKWEMVAWLETELNLQDGCVWVA